MVARRARPDKIAVDGVGRFANGVGTFFADDTFDGKPIRVRGMFTPLTARSMQWEQAFSPDGGRTWETNYVMHHTRIDDLTSPIRQVRQKL